ncbi:conserved hypothetical protein [Agrobacterium genomosp. 13 str. CFBP 6927]|uniref:Transposase n=1 Tax=Agrobacterium genomosp. 13 str. CFBP 6927 TaxID=1183428 RepID=A0ABP2BE70_9HYPH|nr:conserved hypothetical protein [Agrobacterium genomosp. 13 str. CFBP 6927]
MNPPSFLCLSQESSRRTSVRREEPFQPKDLGWLDSCDRHRNEVGVDALVRKHRGVQWIPISPEMTRPQAASTVSASA